MNTAWPITAVCGDSWRWKTLVSRTSRLIPISRPGIMIGSVIPIRTPFRNGSRERTSGNAAAVPTIVDTIVTSNATFSDVVSASWIW